MQITKDFLLGEVAALQKQQKALLDRALVVGGAIQTCQSMIAYLDSPEPDGGETLTENQLKETLGAESVELGDNVTNIETARKHAG